MNLIDQAINLALTGMSTVFIFLTLLILLTITMSKVTSYLGKEVNSVDNKINLIQKQEIARAIALKHHNNQR